MGMNRPITTQAGLRSVTRNAEPKMSQLSRITFVIGGFSFSSLFDGFRSAIGVLVMSAYQPRRGSGALFFAQRATRQAQEDVIQRRRCQGHGANRCAMVIEQGQHFWQHLFAPVNVELQAVVALLQLAQKRLGAQDLCDARDRAVLTVQTERDDVAGYALLESIGRFLADNLPFITTVQPYAEATSLLHLLVPHN